MAREPHLIFLSHYVQDKAFVRKLHTALRNAGHDPFFDVCGISPGEVFPPHILQNARECKLGVVVLSPGFLISKWSMIQLHTMHTSPLNPTLLPLFLSVQPDDLKPSSPSFSTWKNAWQAMAERDPAHISVSELEAAAHELSKIQGESHNNYIDEEDFIEAVLRCICGIIRPPLHYDVSHLTGHERLTQVVADLFDKMPTTSHSKARAIGFHAIGGQGKTTVCKLMANHYTSAYAGRCTLIEFPSNDYNEKEVVRQCEKGLQQLTNIGQANMNGLDSFDQCLQWMKEQVSGRNVFIAIDNVWEGCLGYAQRILDVGFSRGSIILVTSRSGQVLLNLLKVRSSVMPLPGVSEDEARQILVKSLNRNQASDDVELEDADVHNVTELVLSHGGYHPLTISAVGVSLGRTGEDDWLAAWERLSFTNYGSVADKAIKINFDSIPQSRRDMFLDVALIYIPVIQESAFYRRFDHGLESHPHGFSDLLLTWLSALYTGEMDKTKISMTLMQLACDGLLECENSEVHVHELYRDLATREAVGSHRFVLSDNKTLQGIDYAEVERIVCGTNPGVFPEYIDEQNLPKLQVLVVPSCNEWRPVRMPQLHVLKLHIENCGSVGWRDMPKLSWLDLKIQRRYADFRSFRISEDIMWYLRNLSVLRMEGEHFVCVRNDRRNDGDERRIDDSERLCLDCLVNLQFLFIVNVDHLYEISGLGSLINLKCMILQNLPCLLRVGNFNNRSTPLQVLSIDSCDMLRDVAGPNLSAMPDLRVVPALEFLSLHFPKEANVTVKINGLPKLRELRIHGGRVEEIGDGLPRLERLYMEGCDNKELDFCRSLRNLVNLQELTISSWDALEEIDWSSLNDLTSLTCITIECCAKLEHIKGEPNGMNHTICFLCFLKCPMLKELRGLNLLTQCALKDDIEEFIRFHQNSYKSLKRHVPFQELDMRSTRYRRN